MFLFVIGERVLGGAWKTPWGVVKGDLPLSLLNEGRGDFLGVVV